MDLGIIGGLTPARSQPDTPDVYEVTHAFDLIRRGPEMTPAEIRLLTYLLEETLGGRGEALHQKTIAEDVFGRDIRSFDARSDSIVRTTAANLRQALFSYYSGRGQSDFCTIELPRGSYVLRFSRRPRLSADATSRLWSARTAMEARTVSGYRNALRHLDHVIEEAPHLSLPLALKAEVLASQAIHGARPRPNLEQARAFAARAIATPQPAWQAWLAQGIVQQALEWNWGGAEESYGKALELSGGESASHVWYTAFLVGRGRPREAVANLQRYVDQFGYASPTSIGDLSMLLILARDYSTAATVIDAAIDATPVYYQHHLHRAILLEAQGDPGGAVRVLDRTPLGVLERPVTWGLRGLFAGLSGTPQVALRRLAWMQAIRKTGAYVPHGQIGACWIGAGNIDEGVASFRRAAEDRDPLAVWFGAYPMLRHLHGHPGFQRLVNEIGTVMY